MKLSADHEAALLRAAREVEHDDDRDIFFKHCADLLRPILRITDRDVFAAISEARKRMQGRSREAA
jgi:hypothetical protein